MTPPLPLTSHPSPSSLPPPPHLSHTLHSSCHVSTFDHLQSLFQLDDSHPTCSCHWCESSPYHRKARRGRRQRGWVSMVAPMVRYSHLPFRLLCRQYGADIAFTPMIIAAGFNRSQLARNADFQTNHSQPSTHTDTAQHERPTKRGTGNEWGCIADRSVLCVWRCVVDQPLIVQFGCDNPNDLQMAASLALPYVQGIDLNCGCPQRWAIKSGYGAALIEKPELVHAMVRSVRNVTTLPVSIKIRVKDDIHRTVELVRQAEAAGVSFITVHGRTVTQRKEPVNREAIAMVTTNALTQRTGRG